MNAGDFTGSLQVLEKGPNARFYSPRLTRFLQPDSIVPGAGNPQNLNRFAYVGNNPLNFIDPSGHDQTKCYSESGQQVQCGVILLDAEWTPEQVISGEAFADDPGGSNPGGGNPGNPGNADSSNNGSPPTGTQPAENNVQAATGTPTPPGPTSTPQPEPVAIPPVCTLYGEVFDFSCDDLVVVIGEQEYLLMAWFYNSGFSPMSLNIETDHPLYKGQERFSQWGAKWATLFEDWLVIKTARIYLRTASGLTQVGVIEIDRFTRHYQTNVLIITLAGVNLEGPKIPRHLWFAPTIYHDSAMDYP